jgi:hypothetical protein
MALGEKPLTLTLSRREREQKGPSRNNLEVYETTSDDTNTAGVQRGYVG